jgi:hypothetical protein
MFRMQQYRLYVYAPGCKTRGQQKMNLSHLPTSQSKIITPLNIDGSPNVRLRKTAMIHGSEFTVTGRARVKLCTNDQALTLRYYENDYMEFTAAALLGGKR